MAFRSFLQGGFEGSTHRRQDGRQLDVIAASRHDEFAETDYRLLHRAGLRTVRDALRWHLIETSPGRYDWGSFLPMLRAARAAGVQVIWDICHYGLPHDIDIWSAGFVDRFAAFAGAAAAVFRRETDDVPWWSVINEMSFWSWGGGDVGALFPNTYGRGTELKRQLVRASIAAIEAVRAVDGRARLVQAEPMIHIAADPNEPETSALAEYYRVGQFQSWDMLCGMVEPDLGGRPDYLDVLGANFYSDNQWTHDHVTIGLGHRAYRPFHEMLVEAHDRYRRPIVLSETGAERPNGPGWLRYVGGELRLAMRMGVPVEGLCLYPVMDYPGWSDARHCPVGLIRADRDFAARSIDPAVEAALQEEAALFAPLLGRSAGLAMAAE